METFIYNCAICALGFGSWVLIGLGPSILILPAKLKNKALYISPLIGMSLLALIGLWQITVLLTPLKVWLNFLFLTVFSIFCLIKFKEKIFFSRKSLILITLPFILIFIFAWLFHSEGFQLFLGGSDQLQYAENARHMAELMHTNTPNDMPVARQDFYLYDLATKYLPYLKTYRRGAEVLLASMTVFTGLSYEQAFPIVILCNILTLLFALTFLALVFLRLSLRMTLVLQTVFLSSFYFLLLHIQGSLALTTGIAPILLSLAFLTQATRQVSWQWIISTAVITASALSIYSEPALINLIMPCVLILLYRSWQGLKQGGVALFVLSTVFFLMAILTPYSFYSVIHNTGTNLAPFFKNLIASFSTSNNAHMSFQVESIFNVSWGVASVIFGFFSYYDQSIFNTEISLLFTRNPIFSIGVFSFLVLLGALGNLKRKTFLTTIYAFILLTWFGSIYLLAAQQDTLRFARALQYSFPFVLIGIVLLISNQKGIKAKQTTSYLGINLGLKTVAILTLSTFVFLNVFTNWRTVKYLASYNISTDPILLRFNELHADWKKVKEELRYSKEKNIPVLISSYKEVIRPVAIADLIRMQPHVLGTTMGFWPVYATPVPPNKLWVELNTRVSTVDLKNTQDKEGQLWANKLPNLIDQSEQAVVPANEFTVEEWKNQKDIYPYLVKHFPNIGNIIYRNKYAIEIDPKNISSLEKDKQGFYRILTHSGYFIFNTTMNKPCMLSMEYDGQINDIMFKKNGTLFTGIQLPNNRIKISAPVEKNSGLEFILSRKIKVREIKLEDITTA